MTRNVHADCGHRESPASRSAQASSPAVSARDLRRADTTMRSLFREALAQGAQPDALDADGQARLHTLVQQELSSARTPQERQALDLAYQSLQLASRGHQFGLRDEERYERHITKLQGQARDGDALALKSGVAKALQGGSISPQALDAARARFSELLNGAYTGPRFTASDYGRLLRAVAAHMRPLARQGEERLAMRAVFEDFKLAFRRGEFDGAARQTFERALTGAPQAQTARQAITVRVVAQEEAQPRLRSIGGNIHTLEGRQGQGSLVHHDADGSGTVNRGDTLAFSAGNGSVVASAVVGAAAGQALVGGTQMAEFPQQRLAKAAEAALDAARAEGAGAPQAADALADVERALVRGLQGGEATFTVAAPARLALGTEAQVAMAPNAAGQAQIDLEVTDSRGRVQTVSIVPDSSRGTSPDVELTTFTPVAQAAGRGTNTPTFHRLDSGDYWLEGRTLTFAAVDDGGDPTALLVRHDGSANLLRGQVSQAGLDAYAAQYMAREAQNRETNQSVALSLQFRDEGSRP